MNTLNIAMLQMASCGVDQDANLKKGERFCRLARYQGADIALFPEMWNIGYTHYSQAVWDPGYDPKHPDDKEKMQRAAWQGLAIDTDGLFMNHFRSLARELEMAMVLTYLEKWPEAPRNSLSIIDRNGDIVLTYAKVHTCDFSLEAACTPGGDFHVCDLETAAGTVTVGVMICYDREFPESARILMLKGAEIILTPNACELEVNRLGQFRARAYENMTGMVMTNYAAPDSNGHSCAFDGMAFDRQERSRDTCLIEADESEGVFMATFDLDALRVYRNRETWGNAYRKPACYKVLTDSRVHPPFIRPDARR